MSACGHSAMYRKGDEVRCALCDLRSAEQDRDAARELLAMHNLGGRTDYNDGPMKRALAAEEVLRRILGLCDAASWDGQWRRVERWIKEVLS